MIKVACLSVLVATFLPPCGATFTWDKDTLENCEERKNAGRCFKDTTTFYQCPLTCSEDIQDAGFITQGEADDAELFWELELSMPGSKKLTFDRFEGYVTLAVVIPLMPGMAQYYYDMLEHIHKVYPFTIEILVFPIRREDYPDVQLTVPEKTKIIMLPELIREGDKIKTNPVLDYLEGVITTGPQETQESFIYTVRIASPLVHAWPLGCHGLLLIFLYVLPRIELQHTSLLSTRNSLRRRRHLHWISWSDFFNIIKQKWTISLSFEQRAWKDSSSCRGRVRRQYRYRTCEVYFLLQIRLMPLYKFDTVATVARAGCSILQ